MNDYDKLLTTMAAIKAAKTGFAREMRAAPVLPNPASRRTRSRKRLLCRTAPVEKPSTSAAACTRLREIEPARLWWEEPPVAVYLCSAGSALLTLCLLAALGRP